MLSFLFGGNKLKDAIRMGASIVDVRTVYEYDQGRYRGSINIPIERLASSIERISDLKKPIIFCSDGDGRSAKAMRYLKRKGINEVLNGGNWEKLARIRSSL